MSFGVNSNINNINYPSFKNGSLSAPQMVSKPIEKVENIINNTVDTFVKEPADEEKKKSHKTAITAGSTVLVLSAIVAMLNPRVSGKLVNKLNSISSNAKLNVQKNKNNFLKTNFYKSLEKFTKGISGMFQFVGTANGTKDIGFKWICNPKSFSNVKNDTIRKILQSIDGFFCKGLSKAHNAITSWFDSISKHTVLKNYKSVNKKMKSYEDLILTYKDKLSPAEQKLLEQKLNEVNFMKQYFSQENVAGRLVRQENIMSNLEGDFVEKLKDYRSGFKFIKAPGTIAEKTRDNVKHIKNNLTNWAEDILQPQKDVIVREGNSVVSSLVGDGKGVKGKYNEILELLAPNLSKEENMLLENGLKKVNKKITKANETECIKYFDKKRDLVLGGAPTDILTAVATLGASGIAIGTADSKDDRISRSLTLGFPAIAGLGTNFAFTAMLFSGSVGIIAGSAATYILSKIGSTLDKLVNPKKPTVNTNNKIAEVTNV